MNRITSIIEKINQEIQTVTGITDNRFNENVRLYTLDNRRYSVDDEGQNDKITIDDRYSYDVYHRILDIQKEEIEDYSYGRKRAYWYNYDMICIVIMNGLIDTFDKIEDIVNSIPQEIKTAEHERVLIEVESIETDQDSINQDEFNVTYEKHKPKFNIYRINYNIRLINCE